MQAYEFVNWAYENDIYIYIYINFEKIFKKEILYGFQERDT